MKAVYMKPTVKVVPLTAAFAIMAGSTFVQEFRQEENLSRHQDSMWDDDVEVEDLHGWFQ